ncbi:MAG: cyclase family protein [Bdellovibrionales bacterium]|nr:cyclase family protein [Bdellovibrionales bacterium]
MEIIDISPTISKAIAVWPGDTPFARDVLMDTDKGDHIGLSKIQSTLHLGAHTDAPNHYMAGGEGISDRSLHFYFGACQVIECQVKKGASLQVADVDLSAIRAPRVIFKTGSFPDPNSWNEDFCSLSAELIDRLAEKKILLVGIDTPSIDPFSSKDLPAHQAVAHHNMAILEGVVLENVDAGEYQLCALPLKIRQADASPVRAVLIKE